MGRYSVIRTAVIGLGLIGLVGVAVCQQADPPVISEQSSLPPVVDTLRGIFEDLHGAMLARDQDRFFSLLDPTEGAKLQKLVRQYGYLSLKSYIERQFAQWPDLDTLSVYEIKEGGDYLRLTLTGPGTRFGYREPRIRYTFLLFRRHGDSWRLAAVTDLESEQFDPYGYGYEKHVHETDLPPKLRFPRVF